MSGPGDARLQRLLGGLALAALRERLRRRYQGLPAGAVPAPLRLAGLQAHEHAALAGLLGRPASPAASMLVDLAQIDAALQRAGLGASLRDALEQLDGPIGDPAGARAQLQAGWAALLAATQPPQLASLLGQPAGAALFKRLARQPGPAAIALLQQAGTVVQRLPAAGVARAALAAQTLGDAHALDRGAPVATLVLAALRRAGTAVAVDQVLDQALEGQDLAVAGLADPVPGVAGDAAAPPQAAPANTAQADERDRDIWASAGVLVNALARPALALNLPLAGGHCLSAGEPLYLSLRQLLRAPPAWGLAGQVVFVCENPNLVAMAADLLGATCAPLVCTDGMPAAAQRCLLQQLVAAGATLHYHGDFDWPGLQIANQVRRLCGAADRWQPWRLCAADYQHACHISAGRPLQGPLVAATWDSTLAAAMQTAGRAIDEEALAECLLADLADPARAD